MLKADWWVWLQSCWAAVLNFHMRILANFPSSLLLLLLWVRISWHVFCSRCAESGICHYKYFFSPSSSKLSADKSVNFPSVQCGTWRIYIAAEGDKFIFSFLLEMVVTAQNSVSTRGQDPHTRIHSKCFFKQCLIFKSFWVFLGGLVTQFLTCLHLMQGIQVICLYLWHVSLSLCVWYRGILVICLYLWHVPLSLCIWNRGI